MNELTIIKRNDGAYIDSREVAGIIGKAHKNLLRDIAGYIGYMKKSTKLNFEPSKFFLVSTYFDSTGRTLPCYLLSKMGCEMVANKLTGEKGVLFTAAYVFRFNQLETAEREREIKAYNRPRLSEFNGAVKNVLNGMTDACVSPECVMDFLRGIYKPLGIEVSEDGGTPCFYTATDIAQFHGVYSETGRPHAHAVAAIISKLNIHESHMIVVPYGLVGVTFRYDIDVVVAVMDWLINNGFPTEVPHLDFDYHIYYKHEKATAVSFILDLNNYTDDELDAMCGVYDGDCDKCPGRNACCN